MYELLYLEGNMLD